MARPRTPSNVLEMRGSTRKHPERARERANEPKPDAEIGEAPDYLSEAERAVYAEVVRKAHAGVLCDADSVTVEAAAILIARMRANTAKFSVGEFSRLQAVLGSLGMTPADRSKVAARKKDGGPDPLDEFATN